MYAIETSPPSEAVIRKVVNSVKARHEKVLEAEHVPEPMRTRLLKEDVQLLMSTTLSGKTYSKIQEWKSGSLYRRDEAVGAYSMQEAAKKTNYDLSYINLISETNGTISKVKLYSNHDTRSYEVNSNNQQSLYTEVDAWDALIVEEKVSVFFALSLASMDSIKQKVRDENKKLSIDRTKLRRVLSGHDPIFKVSLDEKMVDGMQLNDFELEFMSTNETHDKEFILIECEKTNYNRITRTELRSANGDIDFSSVRRKFDSHDFPHEYIMIESGDDDYTTNTFLIQEIDLRVCSTFCG